MKPPSEWAQKRSKFLRAHGILSRDDDGCVEYLARALDTAYLEGERRGRERAATIVTTQSCGAVMCLHESCKAMREGVEAIRDLPDEPPR